MACTHQSNVIRHSVHALRLPPLILHSAGPSLTPPQSTCLPLQSAITCTITAMFSVILLYLALLFSATSGFPSPKLSELSKRDVYYNTPFLTPALQPASAQTSALQNTIQDLWNSSSALKAGFYRGASQKFPIFGSCNVVIPSVINSTLVADVGYGPGTPQPQPPMVPGSIFNIYMFSDPEPEFRWKSGQDCVKVCLDQIVAAALGGEPSIQCDMWTGRTKNGMPGRSHCYGGYAEASQNGGSNSTICGS